MPEDKAQTEAAGEIDRGRQREDRDKKSRLDRDKHSLETGEVHRDNADKQVTQRYAVVWENAEIDRENAEIQRRQR